jgi:hypothetical protein
MKEPIFQARLALSSNALRIVQGIQLQSNGGLQLRRALSIQAAKKKVT